MAPEGLDPAFSYPHTYSCHYNSIPSRSWSQAHGPITCHVILHSRGKLLHWGAK